MPTRREFLKLALGTGAWLAGAGLSPACRKPQTVAPNGARYWVLILLSGGHDTLYTTDPKLPTEVDELVTLPAENRVLTAGELRFGPHFRGLSRWASELTVLNGVQVRTVNHDTGQKQFFHLKTNIADRMPSALDLIAAQRSGQPLGVAYLNLSSRVMHSPAYFGSADPFYFGSGDVFDGVANSTPGELVALAKVLREQAAGVARSAKGWREAQQTATYLDDAANFFEHVAHVPPLTIEERSTDYVTQQMAEGLERALWLIEHDLCCGVVLDMGLLGWDTHIRNESKQAEMNGNFVRFFDDYLAELHARKNRHGVLADRTLTVVGSELGRYPRENEMLGKDHLPQTSFMFTGPGIRAGKQFGRSGRRMEGLPISYRTGETIEHGRVPVLDDVGTTLLHLAGLDPQRYGYSGEVCDFLLAGTS